MDNPGHDLASLFAQLGLDDGENAMDAFVADHQLPGETRLEEAPFWSEGQRQFIVEARAEDADWVEWVDELDALLHKESMGA